MAHLPASTTFPLDASYVLQDRYKWKNTTMPLMKRALAEIFDFGGEEIR
jgi:hypothetical protein